MGGESEASAGQSAGAPEEANGGRSGEVQRRNATAFSRPQQRDAGPKELACKGHRKGPWMRGDPKAPVGHGCGRAGGGPVGWTQRRDSVPGMLAFPWPQKGDGGARTQHGVGAVSKPWMR